MCSLIPELEKRKSRRAISPSPVSADVVERLLTAATSAASCFNNQPWRFLVVAGEPALSTVKRHITGNNYWADRAPLIILVVSDPEWDCRVDSDRDYALFDTGMATGYLMLQAVREGLVAHAIAGFRAPELKECLGIPVERILITCVVIGYPGDPAALTEKHRRLETTARIRRPLGQVAAYDTWLEVARVAEQ